MTTAVSRPAAAIAMSIIAAFLWAAYYPLVLGVPNGAAPSGLLAWPFVAGGAAFCGVALRNGHGEELRRLWVDPRAWVRVGLLLAMQSSVLASTYLAGAVDTALLSLLGDVVLTPILLAAIYLEGRARARSPVFLAGIATCTGGATLTIVAGGAVRPLTGPAWAVAPVAALAIALYFLVTARANRTTPASAVVGQVTLAGGAVALLTSGIEPGGFQGLVPPTPLAALALLALGLVCFFVAPGLYFSAIERAGLILPAVLMATIPLFTLLLSWAVLGVVPPPIGLAGIPVAVGGAVVALRGVHEPWTTTYASRSTRSGDGAREPSGEIGK